MCPVTDTVLSGNSSEVKVRILCKVRSFGFQEWSMVVNDLPATAAILHRSLHWDRCTHSYTHPQGLCVYGHTHDQGANVHTWSHIPCIDEHTYAHTHINSLWVSDLICTYLHTHTLGQLLIDLHMHTPTHTPWRSTEWWTAVLMCSDRLGCFLSFPLAFPPSGDTHRCLGERDPPPAGAFGGSWWKREGGDRDGNRGTSCFLSVTHSTVWTPLTLSDMSDIQ